MHISTPEDASVSSCSYKLHCIS